MQFQKTPTEGVSKKFLQHRINFLREKISNLVLSNPPDLDGLSDEKLGEMIDMHMNDVEQSKLGCDLLRSAIRDHFKLNVDKDEAQPMYTNGELIDFLTGKKDPTNIDVPK